MVCPWAIQAHEWFYDKKKKDSLYTKSLTDIQPENTVL
jgi:hypothetical protein